MTMIRTAIYAVTLSSILVASTFAQNVGSPTPPSTDTQSPQSTQQTPPQSPQSPEVQKAQDAFVEAQQRENEANLKGDAKLALKWKKKREQAQKKLEDVQGTVGSPTSSINDPSKGAHVSIGGTQQPGTANSAPRP